MIHLGSLADTTGSSFSNVSGLAAEMVGDWLVVIVASGLGMTRLLEVDLSRLTAERTGAAPQGGPGDDLLRLTGPAPRRCRAGAGDDTIIDGRGAARLSGGTGADVVVFGADEAIDRVVDFDPDGTG